MKQPYLLIRKEDTEWKIDYYASEEDLIDMFDELLTNDYLRYVIKHAVMASNLEDIEFGECNN